MPSSWFTRFALATCALLLTAAVVLWMDAPEEESSSPALLETMVSDRASREFLQARELQRAAEARREEGSVVLREEHALAELPANAVRIRVIDANGRGVANIPVGLIDLVAVPLPFFAMVSSWSSNRGEFGDQPPTEDKAWFVRNGLARKEADVVFDTLDVVEVASSSVIELPVDEAGEVLSAQLVPTHNLPGDIQSIDPKSVFFADAFLWRGVTDAEGESIATWDRERFPLVEASFAFPWRANGLQLLRAEDSHGSREVTLVLPEIRRTRVVGVHDLAVCAEATWRAHLIARGAGKDGGPIWISWDPFVPLSEAQEQAREWIWERGLDVEVEAYLDAPFAPVITEDRLVASESSDAVTTLRSSSHYAGATGELRLANGAIAAHAVIDWEQTEWPEDDVAQFTSAQMALDAEGRFQLVQAASPRAMRARELFAQIGAEPTGGMHPSARVEEWRLFQGLLIRDIEREQRETYFDTSIVDPPGSVRDLGIQSLGDGPQLLAGVVRWTDGEAIPDAMVLLARDVSAIGSDDREAIRTNEQGMFKRLGIPRPRQCELEVITGSIGPRSRFTVELGRTDLVLEVPRRGGLAGKILFERPTAIEVHAQDCGGEVQAGRVNSAGNFVVQGIAVGPVKVSFRAHGVVLREMEDIVLSTSELERPTALAEVDLRALAYLMTVVLHDEEGEPLRQATTTVRDPDGSFRYASPTNRLAELRIAVPLSVRRLVIASPRYRDVEIHPAAGRVELRLVAER